MKKTYKLIAIAAAAIATVGHTQAEPVGHPGSPATARVAAANSSAADKSAADFVCTGTNDEAVLTRAIETLTRGGTLKLADGDYYIDAFPCEGNTHLPLFGGSGHLTAIDFNLERFNAAYIPESPDGGGTAAREVKPGSWRGYISYTMQGNAFNLKRFWADVTVTVTGGECFARLLAVRGSTRCGNGQDTDAVAV